MATLNQAFTWISEQHGNVAADAWVNGALDAGYDVAALDAEVRGHFSCDEGDDWDDPNVTLEEVISGTELYERYPGQTQPQDVCVELDCAHRVLRARSNPEVGNAVTSDVWHHHTLRWTIPTLREEPANQLLHEVAWLAERVCDGYKSVWDGNNHVAEYDADADEAQEAIELVCNRADSDDAVRVWEASDWLGGIGNEAAQILELGITGAMSDEALSDLRERIEVEAAGEDVDIVEGLEEYLERLRAAAAEQEGQFVVWGRGAATWDGFKTASPVSRLPETAREDLKAHNLVDDDGQVHVDAWCVLVQGPESRVDEGTRHDDAVIGYCSAETTT
jgi:hypothetical protein